MSRLVLLATTLRIAPGLLSADAWAALRAGPVLCGAGTEPLAEAIVAAGIEVERVDADQPPDLTATRLYRLAEAAGTATWLVGAAEDPVVAAIHEYPESERSEVSFSTLSGSWDLPGARLLDVVATMDRLRSPGGCPWDAEQDHRTLAPYLIEEAYEALQAIEDGDLEAMRDELGDVLLQVAFHARIAEELPADRRWSIDDVATGLVDKLVRRHPHVFADVEVDGAEQVSSNWDAIKAAERGGRPAVSTVPLSGPALTLAATLQRKAEAGEVLEPARLPAAAADFGGQPSAESAGELLWAVVATCRAAGIDPEAALRARARSFRDEVLRDHRISQADH